VTSRYPKDYHAYLLRLWREEESLPWRAELVSPQTGEKHHFASHKQLLAFLRGLMEEEEGKIGSVGD
jgi:hypothetical protein